MRKLIVPEGKVLFIAAGNYRFHGPIEIPESTKLRFPTTYEDGTPVIYSDSSENVTQTKPDNQIPDTTHGLDNTESGQGDQEPWTHCSGLSGYCSIPQGEREDN